MYPTFSPHGRGNRFPPTAILSKYSPAEAGISFGRRSLFEPISGFITKAVLFHKDCERANVISVCGKDLSGLVF